MTANKIGARKNLKKTSDDPLCEIIRITLLANPDERANDVALSESITKLKNTCNFYESDTVLLNPNKAEFYFKNLPFALKMGLISGDEIKKSLNNVKNTKNPALPMILRDISKI